MSRIGKKPVALPKGVTASVDGQTVKVKGPKGELSVTLVREVSAKVDDHGITVTPDTNQERASQMWGLSRSLVNNLVTGVTANEEQILQPGEVLNALARLPASAWPYGRAVAILVEEKPTVSESDKVAIRRSRGIVEGDLQSAHVAINWIPTS